MNRALPTRADLELLARSNDALSIPGAWAPAERRVWDFFSVRIPSMMRLARRAALPEPSATITLLGEPAYVLDDLVTLLHYPNCLPTLSVHDALHEERQADVFADAQHVLAQIDETDPDIALAKDIAYRAFNHFVEITLVPDRVLLTRDRDIAFYFFGEETLVGGSHRRFARLSCSAEGVTVMLEDRLDGTRDVTEVHADDVALDQAAAHIQGFLS